MPRTHAHIEHKAPFGSHSVALLQGKREREREGERAAFPFGSAFAFFSLCRRLKSAAPKLKISIEAPRERTEREGGRQKRRRAREKRETRRSSLFVGTLARLANPEADPEIRRPLGHSRCLRL